MVDKDKIRIISPTTGRDITRFGSFGDDFTHIPQSAGKTQPKAKPAKKPANKGPSGSAT